MNKKVLSLVLALVIVLGAFGTVFAAEEPEVNYSQAQKIQWLQDRKVVEGRKVNENSDEVDLALDKTITRAEITKLIVYTLKQENLADVLKGVMKPFPDVAIDHWANGFISVATTEKGVNGRRIVIGHEDGNFKPDDNVTYAELATMLVRIAKADLTEKMEEDAIWATSYMRWADELGILKGLNITDSNKAATRADAFEMIFNAMYKLGKYDKAAANYGDVMGIVSKAVGGTIELNQNPEMRYKVTFDSRATDGTNWRDIAENAVKPGSLVRLIADKDNNVRYIIELGNSRNAGAIESRWFDVADKVAETKEFDGRANVVGNAYFTNQYFRELTIGNVTAKIDKDTKFFVADVDKIALREVESLDEVFRHYIGSYRDLEKVYMGYNEYHGRAEAKVIVFGKVDKYKGNTEYGRVTRFLGSNIKFGIEDTKGVETVLSLDSNTFPGQKLINPMDVVEVPVNVYDNGYREFGHVIIDYKNDPVFRVESFDLGKREIKLTDEFNYTRKFYTKNPDIFLEDQLRKGVHVQVDFNDDAKTEIGIISIVNKDLEGALPNGVRAGMEDGWIVRYETLADGRMTVTIAGTKLDNGEYRNLTTYEVATDWREVVKNFGADTRVVFDIGNKFGATPYIYNVELYKKSGVIVSEKSPVLTVYDAIETIADGNIVVKNGEDTLVPMLSEVVVKAATKVNGKALRGFTVVGEVTKLVEDAANGKLTFKMPAKGNVVVKPVYEELGKAYVENKGICPLEILAVNGYEIEKITVAPGETVEEYVPVAGANKGNTVKFLAEDEVVLRAICDVDANNFETCSFKGVKVTNNCNLTNKEIACTKVTTKAYPTCGDNNTCELANGQACLRCVVVVKLDKCVNSIEAESDVMPKLENQFEASMAESIDNVVALLTSFNSDYKYVLVDNNVKLDTGLRLEDSKEAWVAKGEEVLTQLGIGLLKADHFVDLKIVNVKDNSELGTFTKAQLEAEPKATGVKMAEAINAALFNESGVPNFKIVVNLEYGEIQETVNYVIYVER